MDGYCDVSCLFKPHFAKEWMLQGVVGLTGKLYFIGKSLAHGQANNHHFKKINKITKIYRTDFFVQCDSK